MKFKLLFSFLLAGGMTLSAQQGYKDGIEYFRADQPEEAEMILTKTLNDASTDKAASLYYLGQIALQKGNTAEATKDFNEGLQANPQYGYNHVGLGMVALKAGDKKLAGDEFKAAREADKKDAAMLVDIARAYYNADPVAYAKEIEKYIEDAKKVSKKNPEPSIYILEADMLAPTDPGAAAGYYEMAQQADPNTNYPEAYVKYARTYFSVNPQFAIDKLKALLEKQPNSALAQRELAEKYYDSNRLTLAAEQYGKYIANPNHFKKDEIRYVALLCFGEKFQESFDLAEKILKEDPNNIYMQRMQFLDMAKMEKYPEAKQYAEKFFSNPTANKDSYVASDYTTYGTVLQELGQDTLGAAQYETAVQLNPGKTELLKDLSSAYTKAKMYEKAAEAQQRFVDSGDAVVNDYFMLARRYQNAAATATDSIAKLAAVDNALKNIDYVLERVPDNATIALTKARILFVKNNNAPDQATVDAFLAALAILDKDPANKEKRKNDYTNAYNQIANFYLNQGDKENAKLYFTKFLEVDPTNEPLRQYIENMK